jgi:hypothetical protein
MMTTNHSEKNLAMMARRKKMAELIMKLKRNTRTIKIQKVKLAIEAQKIMEQKNFMAV